jgi:hypothetical protein
MNTLSHRNINLPLFLIKYQDIKMHVGMELWIHAFLTLVLDRNK